MPMSKLSLCTVSRSKSRSLFRSSSFITVSGGVALFDLLRASTFFVLSSPACSSFSNSDVSVFSRIASILVAAFAIFESRVVSSSVEATAEGPREEEEDCFVVVSPGPGAVEDDEPPTTVVAAPAGRMVTCLDEPLEAAFRRICSWIRSLLVRNFSSYCFMRSLVVVEEPPFAFAGDVDVDAEVEVTACQVWRLFAALSRTFLAILWTSKDGFTSRRTCPSN
mmetsp:Transcript_14389/g.35929  ORF Transcript_14389/g.35929 Transcript_14389/m.35929 type:complete len:222 (-) Transcript_14389:1365-2030(-)